MAVQFFVNGALFASFLPRLPEIRDRVDISVDRVGLILSLAGLAGLAGSAMVGPAISRLGTRRVILGGGTLLALSLPIVGLAAAPWVLLVGLIGMQTFDVLVDVAMNLQGSWLSGRRHTPVMNRLHGLWSLGTVVGGLSSSRLAAAGVSLSVHLTGAAALLLVAIVYVGRGLLRIDEHPTDEQPVDGAAVDGAAVDGAAVESRGSEVRRRSGSARSALFLLGAAGLFAVAVETTSSDWAAFRFTDDLGSSPGQAGLAFVAVTSGMTVGRFVGDWATMRLGPDRLRDVAAGLAFIGLAVATLLDEPVLNLAGLFLAGLGTSSMLPAIYDRAAKHPGRPGAGLGALTAGLRVSGLSMPLTVGLLAGTSLSVGSAMAIVTLPAVIGFALVGRTLSRH